jgi:glycyl-tRNA synthetase
MEMKKLVSLCKRRGFIYPSSEIYGGINGCWDYGPLGVELKRNIKELWWRDIVLSRTNVVGMDASILMHPDVWKASGHVDSFYDPMVDCKSCKKRFRADEVAGGKCPECGGELTEQRSFELMFKTFLGAVEDKASTIYLRPETAQGIFVQFPNVLNDSRQKLPFGIAQIGKAFRNEINPRNYTFRSREFEQMELEFFIAPNGNKDWFEFWVGERMKWYKDVGIREENLRTREHRSEELAHYAKKCVDVEYNFPFGWQELEGIADRQDFDLSQHAKFSGKNLTYHDEKSGESFIPHVIESSAGVDRILLTLLVDAYDEEPERVVLRFSPKTAPIKVGVFPLLKKSPLVERASELEKTLRESYTTFYDDVGAIGRRYRRQDEVGTPCCVTVDFQTLEDDTVTLRDRDSMEQVRVPAKDIISEVSKFLRNMSSSPRPRTSP